MKRSSLTTTFKTGLLAVPAAAMMLGAAQAGTTIGLNFQAWYYDSGTTPQTIGFGQGYQTTGWPATAKAFGVEVANWVNTDPLNASAALDTSVILGSITAHLTTVNMWTGNIGNLVDPANEWTPGFQSTVLPGNDEVTWGYEDNTGWTNDVSGLNAAFPNGYVIELIGAVKCTPNSRVVVSDGVTTTTNAFDVIYTAGNANYPGPVGLLAIPGTTDTLTFGAASRNIDSAGSCALAGIIFTDQPVVSKDPVSTSVNDGAPLELTARVVGVETLSYQWRLGGSPITDATNAAYSVPNVTPADAGDYDVVVTNLYGAATSGVATVTVITAPTFITDLAGVTGVVYAGANFSAWSVEVAGGLPLYYNWFKGASPVGTDSPTLTLTGVTLADSGDYHVTVTNDNGSITSATNFLTVVASPDLYTAEVAQDSPGAYWPLGETSGTIANDYSGAGHNGNISNFVTLGAIGPRPPAYAGFSASKTAYQFDGSSSYIDCGTGPSLSGTTDFTVEAWVKTTATTQGAVVQQRSPSGYNGQYRIWVNANGTVNFLVYGDLNTQFNLTSTTVVNDGNWHHIAGVRRNGSDGSLFVDGVLDGSVTGTTPRTLDGSIATYIGADARDINFGSPKYFDGSISDVAVYDYALSDSRIILHAYTGQYANAPFSLSIVPGGYVLDTKPVGTLHHGANNGTGWSNSITDAAFVPVTRNGVGVFTGSSQVSIPPADADFNSPAGTVCFWVRANAPIPGPGNEGAILFDHRTTVGAVILLDDAGAITWQGQVGSRNTFSNFGYVPDDNWHHVAVTYGQTTSDTLEIFFDGVFDTSTPVTNSWSWPTNQPIEIGRSHDGYWKKLNGQMDDFRIYNRVLTPAEIAAIYASDALVDTSALEVRYNFDTTGGGSSLIWPIGVLESSTAVDAGAVWTPVPGAVPPYPFLPPAPDVPAGTRMFYRAGF